MNEKIEQIIWAVFVMVLTTATVLYVADSSRPKEEEVSKTPQVDQSLFEITKVEK